MDANDIVTLVGNLLFPIVACIFLYRFIVQTLKENTTALNNLADTISDLKATMQNISAFISERKD